MTINFSLTDHTIQNTSENVTNFKLFAIIIFIISFIKIDKTK